MVSSATGEPLSKSAAKNAKRRAKKKEQAQGGDDAGAAAKAEESEPVKDNWEESDGEKDELISKMADAQATKPDVGSSEEGLAQDMQKLDLR